MVMFCFVLFQCITCNFFFHHRGASPFEADMEGETALHYAIRAGRTKNVEILLKIMTDSEQ